MSDNRIVWNGLEELKAELRNLPASLTAEASEIVENAAEFAKSEIVQRYPMRTGNLRDHVTLTHVSGGRFSTGVILKNTAKHAWMYENGTQARHTDLGANRGSMPPGHVFIPAVIRWRRKMYDQLKSMLERTGLLVSGDA